MSIESTLGVIVRNRRSDLQVHRFPDNKVFRPMDRGKSNLQQQPVMK